MKCPVKEAPEWYGWGGAVELDGLAMAVYSPLD